ncbi:MAG: hypothetical protein ACLPXB_04235 [Thiobacillaceae bacterium]
MTMRSTIVVLALTLSVGGWVRYPMNMPSIMMFVVIVFAFDLDFDRDDRSTEEIRNLNDTKGYKRQ